MSGRSDTVKHRLSVGWFARKGSASTFIVVAVSILYPPAIILYSFIGGGFLKFGLSLVGAAVFFIMFLKKTRVGWVRKGVVALILFSMIFWGWYGALWTGFKNYGVILVLLSSLGVTWATLEFGLEKYVYEYPFVFLLL